MQFSFLSLLYDGIKTLSYDEWLIRQVDNPSILCNVIFLLETLKINEASSMKICRNCDANFGSLVSVFEFGLDEIESGWSFPASDVISRNNTVK